jgi:hypothetical protein
MRRIIQSTGAEVIHLGHDRSVEDYSLIHFPLLIAAPERSSRR